jgi:5-hydroxyisourate hydrolase-like protein (transthyretin family)
MCCVYPVIFVAAMAVFQAAPRDKPAAPSERGTAVLGGRVTDKETGLPLARTNVVLRMMTGARQPEARFARTGDDGRYQFTEVAAGSYVLAAETGDHRPTHIPQIYGDTSPYEVVYGLPGKPKQLDVRDGEVRNDLHIAMTRALSGGPRGRPRSRPSGFQAAGRFASHLASRQ